MSKILAIKGHTTRGSEVIALLEMLGGNVTLCRGYNINKYYIIDAENDIMPIQMVNCVHSKLTYKMFTLEEFYEKYPYKVGDIVKFGESENTGTITNIRWHNEDIIYYVQSNHVKDWKQTFSVNILKKYTNIKKTFLKKLTMTKEEVEEHIIKVPEFTKSINLTQSNANKIELVLGDYQIEVRDGKTYAVKKKPVYPKSYEECCNIMSGISWERCLQYSTMPSYKFEEDLRDVLDILRKLLICRNAYWKIAGVQMGLGKPWKPDWCNEKIKYCLVDVPIYGGICKRQCEAKHVLAFPTEEMRDIFYENFKDLIEHCKTLL